MQTLCPIRIIASYTFQPLWVFGTRISTGKRNNSFFFCFHLCLPVFHLCYAYFISENQREISTSTRFGIDVIVIMQCSSEIFLKHMLTCACAYYKCEHPLACCFLRLCLFLSCKCEPALRTWSRSS